jgi:glucose-6-phosphate dehydrogenase assembly protein OpcA
MTESLLPSGVDVAFSEIETALGRGPSDAKQPARMALTATIVATGPHDRVAQAAQAVAELSDVGVRTVLICCGDTSEPSVRVAGHTVALDGIRPEYLNNAVAALRLSSLPTLVWWRGGDVRSIEGLAVLADRLVLDTEDPREVWASMETLANQTSVTDIRWTRLTRWRALMAHFFDIPEVQAAIPHFRSLRLEGSDEYALRLFAGWVLSIVSSPDRLKFELVQKPGAAPIETVVLGGDQELALRMGPSGTCVETAARVNNLAATSRIVSVGDQRLAALLGEELRIRARDVAFERAVVASRSLP